MIEEDDWVLLLYNKNKKQAWHLVRVAKILLDCLGKVNLIEFLEILPECYIFYGLLTTIGFNVFYSNE